MIRKILKISFKFNLIIFHCEIQWNLSGCLRSPPIEKEYLAMAYNLKPDQKKALAEFRRILNDDIPSEIYNDTVLLTKFLKARDFDIKKAVFMIKNNVRWRKEMQVDTILTDFKRPEVLEKYLSCQIIGFDTEGFPVVYAQIGKIDIKGLAKSTNKINLLKTLIQETEKHYPVHRSQSEKYGKTIAQSVGIYDMADLSLSLIRHIEGIQFVLKYLMLVQDNYPEFVKKAFVINAPSFFPTFWAIIQKCFAEELKKKFCVYGQDGWKEELLKIIDAETLPAFLGGNRTDPDGNPLCLNLVNHRSDSIPEMYYLEKDVTNFSQKPGVKSIRIDRQNQVSESIQVTTSNSIINWEFLIKNYDIGFGILLETADGTLEELIPVHKVETEVESYIGMYRCKNPGKYMIIFDNSYSWFHIKEVYYRIWISNIEEK